MATAGASAGEGGSAAGAAGAGGEGGVGVPPLAVAVAGGAFHSCALFDDGSVRCWGTGYYHGYPNTDIIGDDESPSVLGDLDVGGKVESISASWYHTCAVLVGGSVRCWGNGTDGMLGYQNTEIIGDGETPAAAGAVDVGGQVVQISAGPYHTCAVLVGGNVRCWGNNENEQLGYGGGESIGDDESPASAGDVDVGGFALQVAAGYGHSCALRDDGVVRCWGDGPGAIMPGDVELGGFAIQVVAGTRHSCALLAGGNVRCWGWANDGVLGYGNFEHVGDDETPAEAGDVDVGGQVVQLSAGDYGTCALLASGSVRCWGWGEAGELGYGNIEDIGDTETPAQVGDVDVGGVVTSIDMGFLHTCAVLASGAVRCWGRASTGALGYGNIEDIGDDELPASAGDVETH